jgi:transposase-like protein
MKYNKSIAKIISDQLATGKQSIEAICEAAGITRNTFYVWQKKYPEFTELLAEANKSRLAAFGEMALSGLAISLTKHEYTEITTEYYTNKKGIQAIRTQKVVNKFIMPNAGLIQYVLNNRLPDQWKNTSRISFTDETEKNIDRLNDEQLETVIQKLLEKV